MTSGKPHADRIISITAVLIAFCSLILTLYSGYWTRYHNRLSVLPRLYFFASRTEQDPQVGISLSNSGLGPAIIQSWIISVDGQVVGEHKMGWDSALQKLGLSFGKGIHYSSFGVLEAGKQEFIFSINQEQWKNLGTQDREAFNKAMKRIKVTIDYESVYDEHNQSVFDGSNGW